MNPQLLARLSTLLDEALELDEPAREAWLAEPESTSAPLAPALHELLGRLASKETAYLLDQVPCPPQISHPAWRRGSYGLTADRCGTLSAWSAS